MIGFSASFAKTIKFILDELKETDKLYCYVFNNILLAISEGNNKVHIDIPESRYGEIIEVLDYNGFTSKRINKSLILIEW